MHNGSFTFSKKIYNILHHTCTYEHTHTHTRIVVCTHTHIQTANSHLEEHDSKNQHHFDNKNENRDIKSREHFEECLE